MAFVVCFMPVIGIGVYFFVKSKTGGEKDYFFGGRGMSGPVAALSEMSFAKKGQSIGLALL